MSTALQKTVTSAGTTSFGTASSAVTCVEQHLDGMKRAISRSQGIRGFLVTLTATLLTLLTVLIVDSLWQPESMALRFVLLGSGLAVLCLVAKRSIFDPLRHCVNRLDVAWNLEESHPELEERLTSTLQLATDRNHSQVSEKLIGLVAKQAFERITQVDTDRAGGPRMRPAIIAFSFSSLVMMVGLTGWHQYLLPAFANVFQPWNSRVLPRLNATITPGDATVIESETVSIVANGRNLRGSVLEIVNGSAVVSSHPMIVEDGGRKAEFALADIKQDLRYRVRAGRLYSPEYPIEVLTRPVIERVVARLEFPDYTRIDPLDLNDVRGPIDAVIGTRLTVSAVSKVKAAKATLTLDTKTFTPDRIVVTENGAAWLHQWELVVPEMIKNPASITLVSDRDVRSSPTQVTIRTIADKPPTVAVEMHNLTRIAVKPNEKLTVPFQAKDDHGLASLQLLTEKVGQIATVEQLQLPPQVTHHSSEAVIDLSKIDLKPNETLAFWIRATDNRPENFGGGQTTDSQRIEIRIASNAASIEEQAIRQQQRQVEQQLAAAVEKLKASQELAQKLAQASAEAKAAQLPKEIDQAKQALEKLAQDAEKAPLFKQDLAAVDKVAKNEVADAQRQAEQLTRMAGKEQQEQANKLDAKLDEAVKKLEQAQADVRKRNEELQMAAKLDQLARKQEQLAEEMRRREAEKADARKDQQERQQKVAEDLQNLVKKDLDAKAEQFQKRAEEAEQLVKEAGELQKQQEKLAQINKPDVKQQEQLADRTKQLRDKADQLLKRPTDDAENKKANEEAAQKLQKAEEEVKRAEQIAKKDEAQKPQDKPENKAGEKPQEKPGQNAENKPGQNRQQEKPNDKAVNKPQDKPGDKPQPKPGEKVENKPGEQATSKPGENPQEKPGDNPQGKPVDKAENKQGNKPQKNDGEKPQGNPTDNPGNKPQPKPGEQAENKPLDKKEVAKQQEKAADAIKDAMKSLNQVCESCKKCANCNNPGGGGGSNPSNGQASDKPGESKDEKKPNEGQPNPKKADKAAEKVAKEGQPNPKEDQKVANADKPGEKEADGAKPGDKPGPKGQPDSKQLAKAADAANEAAQSPTKKSTEQAAREVNKLADQAANNAKYPFRKQEKEAGQNPKASSDKPGQKSGTTPATNAPKSNGNTEVANSGLNGGSTSNWTRSGKKIQGNVLDEKDAKVPEQYKGVVQDYFEELSRIESKQKSEKKEDDR